MTDVSLLGSLVAMGLFPKIVVTAQAFSRDTWLRRHLEERFPNASFNERETAHTVETLKAALKEADGAIVGRDQINDTILAACKRLQIVAKYGVGLDHIDQDACRRHSVQLGWTPGVNRLSVAEQTVGFMLALCRNLFRSSLYLRDGKWRKNGGEQLSGQTIGIIGVGNIGKEVVRLLEPYACRILVNDIVDQSDYYVQYGLIETSKEQLFAESEIVTLHTPLDESTQNLINQTTLGMMKETAFLINTSRGGVVDEQELKEALINGVIAGAGLDVFEKEPPTDEELLRLPNVICTPHIGGNSAEAVHAMGLAAIEHLERHFAAWVPAEQP